MFQMMKRHWVHVRGSGGKYWVSNDGLIWSMIRNRFIGSCDKNGRCSVTLRLPRETPMVLGRVVYEAFRGEIDCAVLDHIDRNPRNNSIQNLRLVDQYQSVANTSANRNGAVPFKCVSKASTGYFAQITRKKTVVFRRYGKCALTLALAVDDFLHEYDGEFAALNFPERYR